jgi:hypothetical protein
MDVLGQLGAGDHLLEDLAPARRVHLLALLGEHLGALAQHQPHRLDQLHLRRVTEHRADHLAVRRLDEAEVVDPRVRGQRVDQPDVGAFRRLDRAHAPVVRVVHVAHFETRALTGQSARAQRGETPLVRHLGERVRLVHELAELRRPEELLDHRRHRARVHQVVDVDLVRVGHDRHALAHQTRHARQAHAELVGDQLAHRAHPAVAQVVDVVGGAAPLVQLDELPEDGEHVLRGERRHPRRRRREAQPLERPLQALVDLVPAHAAQVVPLVERFLGVLAVVRARAAAPCQLAGHRQRRARLEEEPPDGGVHLHHPVQLVHQHPRRTPRALRALVAEGLPDVLDAALLGEADHPLLRRALRLARHGVERLAATLRPRVQEIGDVHHGVAGLEELLLRPRVRRRRRARPHQVVDGEERLQRAVRGVLAQRGAQRGSALHRGAEHRHLGEPGAEQPPQHLLVQLLTRTRQQRGAHHRDLRHAGGPQRCERLLGEPGAALQHLARAREHHVAEQHRPLGTQHRRIHHVLGQEAQERVAAPRLLAGHRALQLRQRGGLPREEGSQDVHVAREPHGPQQRRGRELLLLVDVHRDHVVDVERELHPRAAERDDPGAEELGAVRMHALLEHHAGRTVQLRDDHPLRAVDDERAQGGQHRQVPEVHFLLDDVLGTALVAHVLPDDQSERRLQRSGVRHVALHALLHVVLGLAERVPYELQGEVSVDVRDREDLIEHPLQPHVLALARGRFGLQQGVERPQLHVEEIG